MKEFRHYITTRFNAGLYRPEAHIRISTDEWMRHRIRLFTSFTLPSMMAQTCQNFTWLVLVDNQTPKAHRQVLEGIAYKNMKLIYPEAGNDVWLANIEAGDYDLITTRLDNDDAFHRDMVKTIQDNFRAQGLRRSKPWVMVFPFGFILDLGTKEMLVLEYWFNNCPSLVEDCGDAKTIWVWQHCEIPASIPKHYMTDRPYWLQVVHSQNLRNEVPANNPIKIIHRHLKPRLEFLSYFGVDVNSLPDS
jgi:hypothetical protein